MEMLRANELRSARRFRGLIGKDHIPVPRDSRISTQEYASNYATRMSVGSNRYESLERNHMVDILLKD